MVPSRQIGGHQDPLPLPRGQAGTSQAGRFVKGGTRPTVRRLRTPPTSETSVHLKTGDASKGKLPVWVSTYSLNLCNAVRKITLASSASFPPSLSFPRRRSKWGLLKLCPQTKVVQSNTLADIMRLPGQRFTASSA